MDKKTWENWLLQGDQYLKASGSNDKKNKFLPSIQYNLISLAFESYAMAILYYNGKMPDNHTYTDLINALDGVIEFEKGIRETILKYEEFQRICSIDNYKVSAPKEDELIELRSVIKKIGELAHDTLR
jgi:hypothetical protein